MHSNSTNGKHLRVLHSGACFRWKLTEHILPVKNFKSHGGTVAKEQEWRKAGYAGGCTDGQTHSMERQPDRSMFVSWLGFGAVFTGCVRLGGYWVFICSSMRLSSVCNQYTTARRRLQNGPWRHSGSLFMPLQEMTRAESLGKYWSGSGQSCWS